MKKRLYFVWLAMTACLFGCGGGEGSDVAVGAVPPGPGPIAAPAYWSPQLKDTWQWQLRGTVNTTYAANVYDIDLFDAPQALISSLKVAGRHVVCYFSAGSAENWRPDYTQFQASDLGNNLVNWPGERWVDTRSGNVRTIIKARLDLAKSKGCDGVEPDNVDGYSNNSGFALSDQTQLDFNTFLAVEAHARGLAVALKNDVGQVSSLEPLFDFAVNEQCFSLGECGGYVTFTSKGKPVFNAEYATQYQNNVNGARDQLCANAKTAQVHTLVLPVQLDDSFRFSCD